MSLLYLLAIANPAASSPELLMRKPLLNLWMVPARLAFVLARLVCDACDWMLLISEKGISFLHE
jgi:hypothetical protein